MTVEISRPTVPSYVTIPKPGSASSSGIGKPSDISYTTIPKPGTSISYLLNQVGDNLLAQNGDYLLAK